MIETTLQYQFVKNKAFVFIVNNKYFTKIDWGDGTPEQIINDSINHSYHKYTTNSVYNVTFTSLKPIPYKLFTSPLLSNGYRYITNCQNTSKFNYSFTEQETSSNRIQKLKDQTIYSNLKSRNPLLTTILPKKFVDYESRINLYYGYLLCQNIGFDNHVLFGGGGNSVGNCCGGNGNDGGGDGGEVGYPIIANETPTPTEITQSPNSTSFILNETTYYIPLFTETV